MEPGSELSTVAIVGAGAAAPGVAQLCLQKGLEVVLVDETEEALGRAEDQILRGLHRAEQPAAFSLLRKATDLRRAVDCDLVLEASDAGFEARRERLCRIDARLAPRRVLAVHTGALPARHFASALENPERLVGVHFPPPAHLVPFAEIACAPQSAERAVDAALGLARALGKTAARCKDSPGLIVNRISRPFFLTALGLLEHGRGTPASLDEALREAGGFRSGPFQWLDFAGLEEELALTETIYALLERPARLKPSALLAKLVARGCRGRRNSRGFYVYGENPPGTVNPLLEELAPGSEKIAANEALRAVVGAVAAEARLLVEQGVASPQDIDAAARLALGWPKGPFAWQKELDR